MPFIRAKLRESKVKKSQRPSYDATKCKHYVLRVLGELVKTNIYEHLKKHQQQPHEDVRNALIDSAPKRFNNIYNKTAELWQKETNDTINSNTISDTIRNSRNWKNHEQYLLVLKRVYTDSYLNETKECIQSDTHKKTGKNKIKRLLIRTPPSNPYGHPLLFLILIRLHTSYKYILVGCPQGYEYT
ncbi:hypothetical protein BDB00DRAFT_216226 [Zychaea mexicana]|uniref:uncharacterized protein n=1 Tax=Zychaea mexicana TaxID=64656 RepID=UPI0022FE71E8|nr:uncharacterized protein BDB00DRAFT_216226 [Zychaea mexicana]KAI9472918.1 hypothetical protein BDB00DRAFT_216226 [Zychaea mexicana]